jgi:hypothetical protein
MLEEVTQDLGISSEMLDNAHCYSYPEHLNCIQYGIDLGGVGISNYCVVQPSQVVDLEKYNLSEIESCKLYYYMLNMGNADKVKLVCENHDSDEIDKLYNNAVEVLVLADVMQLNEGGQYSGIMNFNTTGQEDYTMMTENPSKFESRGVWKWFMIKVNGSRWVRNSSNAIRRSALDLALGGLYAFCSKVFVLDQRSTCVLTSEGQVCASWSGGTNNMEIASLIEMMRFLYDQGDLWELGDSSFVIYGGVNQVQLELMKREAIYERAVCPFRYLSVLGWNFCLSNRPNGCH